jgi:nicotinate-nucleotide adenylyltransferase
MAIGIYGGAFDPVHIGHLITAQRVLELRNLEKIIFIPAYISPFKQENKNSSPVHRINMLELALERSDKFVVSDIEMKRKNVSYTIDTLREIKKDNPDSEFELIIGYDNLLLFHKWYKPDDILKLCKLVVLRREVDKEPERKNIYYDRGNILDTPTIEISSTEIRERIVTDMPIDYLVPLKVKEYIYQNGLYK